MRLVFLVFINAGLLVELGDMIGDRIAWYEDEQKTVEIREQNQRLHRGR
jgi:hypothetical protein